MSLIICPECSSQISDRAVFCPHCGFPMTQPEKPVRKPKKSSRQYPKLPNGFGSIKKLSGNRTNPYGVYPPVTEFQLDGSPVAVKAIAYAKDWYTAFGILSAYNAGTYKPGQEIVFDDTQITDEFVSNIIAAYNYGISARKSELDLTFEQVYQQYVNWDFEQLKSATDPVEIRRLSTRKNSMSAAFKNCSQLHKKIFRSLKYADLQAVIDDCPLKHSSKELILVLFHKMYKYADIADIQKEDRSRHVSIKTADDDISGVPFTDEEFRKIWANRNDPVLEMVCIMCLSGFRIRAFCSLEINLTDNYFKGGVKTKNGVDRIVPIHHSILPLVTGRLERDGCLFGVSTSLFRNQMYAALENIGIKHHTPHDCRDTFATFCDRFGVDKTYLKRLMGHSLSADITENLYIHPSLEALREQIERIDLSLIVANANVE